MSAKLVLGTVQFGLNYGVNNFTGRIVKDEVFEILDYASTCGIKELDTAVGYGIAHSVLAEYFSKKRQYAVGTKISAKNIQGVEKKLGQVLDELGIESLDTLYFHSLDDYLQLECKELLREIKKKYKINNIAVSVYGIEDLRKLIDDSIIDLVQFPFSILDSSAEKVDLLRVLKKKGTKLYARSIFLQGLYFKKSEELPISLRELGNSLEVIQGKAERCGITVEELCIKFVNSFSVIDRLVIGVDSLGQLKSNLSSFHGRLKVEDVESLLSLTVTNQDLLNPSRWS